MEIKQYRTAAFLDISQAFDKVWHERLLYKLSIFLPDNMYRILQSYLTNRYFRTKYKEAYLSIRQILAGVPQGSVLGPFLYLIYTADLPTLANSTTANFADDTANLTVHEDPTMAAHRLQMHLNKIQSWLKTWRMKANEAKSVQINFTLNKMTCPPVKLNNDHLPQADEVKYLGIHLDRRLTWRKHINAKRKQQDLKLRNLYWIIRRKSQLSLENKLLVYKVILKPVWTYGIQLWGIASNSNLEILERFQSNVLRIITDAPRYVPNTIIKSDLQIPMVKQEARKFSAKYRIRLDTQPNNLANTLFKEQFGTRRLKRLYPTDLVTNR